MYLYYVISLDPNNVLLPKQSIITMGKKHMKKTHGPKTMHNIQKLFLQTYMPKFY